jgi:hypothetical protein
MIGARLTKLEQKVLLRHEIYEVEGAPDIADDE